MKLLLLLLFLSLAHRDYTTFHLIPSQQDTLRYVATSPSKVSLAQQQEMIEIMSPKPQFHLRLSV